MAIIDSGTLITLAITNTISGIFIGAGISIGAYFALKRQMPKWIKEIVTEMTKMRTLERALDSKR